METSEVNSALANRSLVFQKEVDQLSGGMTVDAVLSYLTFAIRYVVNLPVLVLSFSACVINVITFSRMNLSQGVTQNLLILSLSDAAYVSLSLPVQVLAMMQLLGYYGEGRPSVADVYTVLIFAMNFPFNVSQLVTTIIAVIRCCSVAMPLSFRSVFTPRRQLVAILSCSFTVTAVLAYLLGVLLAMHFDVEASTNSTYNFRSTDKFRKYLLWLDVVRNALFAMCMSIIIVSMIFLIIALKKSSQFQRSAVTTQPGKFSTKSDTKSAASREAQVVKTTVLILAIFVTCNIFIILLSVVRRILPGVHATGKYRTLSNFLLTINGTSQRVNAGLNFFVYYKYNSRFRQLVRAIFNTRKDTNDED